MYLRHTTRRKDGKVHRYWQLVRSVRVGRKIVQQTVAHLGELDAEGRARARALAQAITGNRPPPICSSPRSPPRRFPFDSNVFASNAAGPSATCGWAGRCGAR
jgi:broad specificity phosphatase PhoE